MTSTASNEYSQHFYTKLGYVVVDGFRQLENLIKLNLSIHYMNNI